MGTFGVFFMMAHEDPTVIGGGGSLGGPFYKGVVLYWGPKRGP